LSLASRLEHSNQTNNSRRWPSVPCFPCLAGQNDWKLELAPFRCSVPHSPSLDPGWKPGREEGVAGTIARILLRVLPAHALAARAWNLRMKLLAFQCSANGRSLHSLAVLAQTARGDGFPIHAEPTNHIKEGAWGQVSSR